MTFTEIFSKDYLLNPTPNYQTRLYIPLIVFFGFLLFIAIFTRFMKPQHKVLVNRYYYCFLTVSILGYTYLFSRYEGLAWLGSRLLLVITIALLLVWLLYNTVSIVLYLPKYKQKSDTKRVYEKYLPKPKKK